MRYVVLTAAFALLAAGCDESKPATLSAAEVRSGLRAQHIDAQEISITISAGKPTTRDGEALGFSEAVVESGADYRPLKTFAVGDLHKMVLVFASAKGAREYNAFMNGMGSQVRNVLVYPADRRVRGALSRLR